MVLFIEYKENSMKHKKIAWLVGIILVVFIVGIGVFFTQTKKQEPSSRPTTTTTTKQTTDTQVKDESEPSSRTKQTTSASSTKKTHTEATTQSKQERHDKTETTSSYDVTKEVNNEGLKPAEEATDVSKHASDDWTMQNDNSIGNKHHLISVVDGTMSFTLLNQGKGSVETNKVKKTVSGDTITLKWPHYQVSFKTDEQGQAWLDDHFK